MGFADTVAPSRRVRRLLRSVVVAMLIADAAALATHQGRMGGTVTWTMVDVTEGGQQGDAHVIEVGDRVVLIDAGTYSLARTRLVPYLARKGIDRIHLALVSHAHVDHFGGIRALMEARIAIDEVQASLPDDELCRREVPWGCDHDEVEGFVAQLARAHIPMSEPHAPRVWQLPHDVTLELIQRIDTFEPHLGEIDVNDTSLVLRLDVADTTVLFTGDLNVESGKYFTRQGFSFRRRLLLKVPHHGTESLPTDDFFTSLDPEMAFVPAPRELWHSERSHRVRTWLGSHHVPTFVSGVLGNVTVHLGKDLRVEAERPAAKG